MRQYTIRRGWKVLPGKSQSRQLQWSYNNGEWKNDVPQYHVTRLSCTNASYTLHVNGLCDIYIPVRCTSSTAQLLDCVWIKLSMRWGSTLMICCSKTMEWRCDPSDRGRRWGSSANINIAVSLSDPSRIPRARWPVVCSMQHVFHHYFYPVVLNIDYMVH